MRTDRHNHRPIAGDSDLAEGVKLLARAHQSAIWSRQRQLNALRSALREYYPGALAAFGTDLASTDALAVLAIAPTPELGRGLSRSKIASALRKGGRQRNIERRAEEIQAALRGEYLEAPALITNAHGLVTRSSVALIATFNAQIAELLETNAPSRDPGGPPSFGPSGGPVHQQGERAPSAPLSNVRCPLCSTLLCKMLATPVCELLVAGLSKSCDWGT